MDNVLKLLLDYIDVHLNLSEQLDALIKDATNLKPWVEALVRTPVAIAYCQSRCIRFDQNSDQIYLLNKIQINSMHVELFSYVLYCTLHSDMTKFSPLRLLSYDEVSQTDIEPRFHLMYLGSNVVVRFSVGFDTERFVVRCSSDDANAVNALVNFGFVESKNNMEIKVARENIEQWLSELAVLFKDYEVGDASND